MDNNETQFNSEKEDVTIMEHLSALLDDEVGSFEQRRTLDELKTNQALSAKLSHFALIGESMRSSKPIAVADSNFLAGIHAQIDSEPEYHNVAIQTSANDTGVKQNAWLRPVGGFALAASVAAVAVVGVQNYQQQNTKPDVISTMMVSDSSVQKSQLSQSEMNAAVIVSADKINIEDSVAAISSIDYKHADAHTRSLLKRFVDKHIRHASTSSFVPSVRVIAYADYR